MDLAPVGAKVRSSGTRTFRTQVLLIAQAQFGLVTRHQIRSAGFSSKQIECAIAAQWLVAEYPGVYAVGRPISSDRAFWLAGVLAAGPGAVLARASAARLWGISDRGTRVDVLRTESRKPRSTRIGSPELGHTRQLLVRRTRYLPDHHVTVVNGIPTTTVERVLLDGAGELSGTQLEYQFLEADRLGLLDDQRLGQILLDGERRSGIRELRRLVQERNPLVLEAESLLEALLQAGLEKRGLPQPEPNAWIGPYRVDFLWRDQGLVVEVDGAAFHSGRLRTARDTERENYLRRRGLEVLRFGWREVAEEADLAFYLIEDRLLARGSTRQKRSRP